MRSYYEIENKEKAELKKTFNKTPGGKSIRFFEVFFWVVFIILNIFDMFTLELGEFKIPFDDKIYLIFFIFAIIFSIYYEFSFRQYIKIKNNIN